jgi:hypothetical protein
MQSNRSEQLQAVNMLHSDVSGSCTQACHPTAGCTDNGEPRLLSADDVRHLPNKLRVAGCLVPVYFSGEHQ